MGDPITREEHEEFSRRIEEEDHRQNRRIDLLEKSVEQFNTLASAVRKLACNMESMLKEQEQQGERLEKLEGLREENWKRWAGYGATFLLGLASAIATAYAKNLLGL